MKLEDQVVSLASAKRLKELGWKQESYFSHVFHKPTNQWTILPHCSDIAKNFPAYTCAELGDILPYTCITYKDILLSWCCLFKNDSGRHIHRERSLTEAECRALMLIYLTENALIAPNN